MKAAWRTTGDHLSLRQLSAAPDERRGGWGTGAKAGAVGDEIDIGNPKHRPAPGQVAQNILVALLVTAGNLDILETWLYQRTGTHLTDADFTADTCDAPSKPNASRTAPPVHAGLPPPRHPEP
ncbi:hypothetical protein ACIBCM_15380 [Streptomyces sp. NPDC051018]|uniref:hypothetical protein n=1 Tax=Streptomyces sp. NPDC051018 TaxID=3365639 RepID=UPI00379D9231